MTNHTIAPQTTGDAARAGEEVFHAASLIRRIDGLVGDIERLKRESASDRMRAARAKLGVAYHAKRPARLAAA